MLADGNVGACICTDLESEIMIGNIHEQSLEEIWKGEALAKYRREWVEGRLPDCCVNCTRYTGVDEFIENNRKRVAIDYARRKAPGLLKLATRGQGQWKKPVTVPDAPEQTDYSDY